MLPGRIWKLAPNSIQPQTCGKRFLEGIEIGTKRLSDREVECLGGLQVDHQFELGWLLDRQARRLRTLENPVRVNGQMAIGVLQIWPVTGDGACLGEQRPSRHTASIRARQQGASANILQVCLAR